MNHNEYKKWIQLSLYGELSHEENIKLQQHLSGCEECRKEIEEQKNLLSVLTERDKLKVNDKLLSDARAQLRGALKNEREKKYSNTLFANKLIEFVSSPYKAALAGVVILLIGFLLGFLFFKSDVNQPLITSDKNNNKFLSGKSNMLIRNLRFIDSDASDGEIAFTFDAVKTISLKGKVDDPQIQNILTYAMLNDVNPGSRLNSINAILKKNELQYDPEIRNVLITVLMSDRNPGVRREALKALQKLPFDKRIKKAYLYVIKNDPVTGLRINAIDALADAVKEGNKLSGSDINFFKTKLLNDKNNFIRYKTRTILQEYN